MISMRLNHDFNYIVRRLNASNVICSCYYMLFFLDRHQIHVLETHGWFSCNHQNQSHGIKFRLSSWNSFVIPFKDCHFPNLHTQKWRMCESKDILRLKPKTRLKIIQTYRKPCGWTKGNMAMDEFFMWSWRSSNPLILCWL